MKGVIASAVIAAVIVAGSVAYTNHIDKVSRELGEINDRVMAFLYEDVYKRQEQFSLLACKRKLLNERYKRTDLLRNAYKR